MDNYRFGSAYQEIPDKKIPTNPERRELLEAPRKWMHFFDETARNYLAGEPAPDEAEFIDKLAHYFVWAQMSLVPLEARVREIHDDTGLHGEKRDVTSEFRFHYTNGPLAFLWHQLLYSETETYDKHSLSEMQAHLAVSMVPSIRRFKQLNVQFTADESSELRSLLGTINEGDAALTLVEIMKNNTNIVALPAPISFESNPDQRQRNTDFLLIDTNKKHSRGIQVKTNAVQKNHILRYDRNYVSVIDAATDLGNTAYSPTRDGHIMQNPGQIALHLLAQRPLKSVPRYVEKREYFPSRLTAIEFTRGHKSFLGQAVIHVTERVMSDLYRNPPEEVDEISTPDELIA